MYRKPLTGFILWLHPVYPRRCQGLPLRGLFSGYQYKARIFFCQFDAYDEAASLKARGPPPVRSRRLNGDANAEDAQNGKKKPAIIYSPT